MPNVIDLTDDDGRDAIEDEDVQISVVSDRDTPCTSVTKVWNRDLPHRRDQCGAYPFTATASMPPRPSSPSPAHAPTPSANLQHCVQCYCGPCDVPADDCPHWPQHCDVARSSSSPQQMQPCTEAMQPCATTNLPRASASTPQLGLHLQYGKTDVAAEHSPGHLPAGAVPPPDEKHAAMLLPLGTIRLPFKVRGCSRPATVQELRKKVLPYGAYRMNDSPDPQYLHLHTVQQHVSLRPVAIGEELPLPPPERLLLARVHFADGRSQPWLCGVPWDRGERMRPTVGQVLSQLASYDLWEADEDVPQLLVWQSQYWTLHEDPSTPIQVELVPSHPEVHVCVLPPPPISPPDKGCRVLLEIRLLQDEHDDQGVCSSAYHVHRPTHREQDIDIPLVLLLSTNYRSAASRAVSPFFRIQDGIRKALQVFVRQGEQLPLDNLADLKLQYSNTRVDNNWKPKPGEVRMTARIKEEYHHLLLPTVEQTSVYLTHESAAEDIIQRSEANDRAHQKYTTAQNSARRLPRDIVDALAKCYNPPKLNIIAAKPRPTGVHIRLSLEEATDPVAGTQQEAPCNEGKQADEVDGFVVLEVSTYRLGISLPPYHYSLLHDLTLSESRKRRSVDDWTQGALRVDYHVLFEYWLRDRPQMQESTQMIEEAYGSLRNNTLPGLLAAMVVEADVRPEAVQPDGLSVTLRPYQLQSLHFMLEAERRPEGFRSLLWFRHDVPDGQTVWYSPALRMVVDKAPETCTGGLLCEEMGLGKTVEMLALILANPAPPLHELPDPGSGRIKSRCTLIVCPLTLIGQWHDELCSKLSTSMHIHMYHGQNRVRDPVALAAYDIVLTTYSTLASDYSRVHGSKKRKAWQLPSEGLPTPTAEDSELVPLEQVQWFRLILDECHILKAMTSNQHAAVTSLHSDRRWGCTGTPISSDVSDLQGQFKALHLNALTGAAFAFLRSWQHSSAARAGLMHILRSVCVRHTAEAALQLPPKVEELVPVTLSEAEQQAYLQLYQAAKERFSRIQSQGVHAASKAYVEVMALLLPLRRICSGGALTGSDLALPREKLRDGAFGTQSATKEVAPQDECAICLCDYERPVRTACKHWFCRECIEGQLTFQRRCPLCRAVISDASLTEGITEAEAAAASAPVHLPQDLLCESKFRALLGELKAMRHGSPSSKALVFSQFTSTLQWLGTKLQEEGFQCTTINGSTSLAQRRAAVESFQNAPPTTVFLLPMRAGSVGLTLTAADHVFMMDVFLNEALERQAVGRAHRMGQTRLVKVKKFYVKGSVEEGIMNMHRDRANDKGGVRARDAAGKRIFRTTELTNLFAVPELD